MLDALKSFRRFAAPVVGALALLAVAGCATPPTDPQDRAEWNDINDPIEPFNRVMFDFNKAFDKYLLKPGAQAYVAVFPEFTRIGIHNVLQNVRSPLIFANDILQGEPTRAATTFWRMVINSTLGIGGTMDVANGVMKMPFHGEDFGQTMAVWGVPEGPYVVLPLFGPSNPRDTAGIVAEFFADPLSIYLGNVNRSWITFTRGAFYALDQRSEVLDTLDSLERTALDYYATMRSVYRQRRADEVRNSRPGDKTLTPGVSGAPAPAGTSMAPVQSGDEVEREVAIKSDQPRG